MYLEHFGFHDRPFAITPDPSVMVWSDQYKRAIDVLLRQSLTPASLTVLIAECGCGKTSLLHHLLQRDEIDTYCLILFISTRVGSGEELLRHILSCLPVRDPPPSVDDKLRVISAELEKVFGLGRVPVLIIDEAHTMSVDGATMLQRIVSSTRGGPLRPSIILSGQPELKGLLSHKDLRPLATAIDARLDLHLLSLAEVSELVEGRLKASGYAGRGLFEDGALKLIHAYSGGAPRLIVKACDLCLHMAAAKGLTSIGPQLVTEALRDFAPEPQTSGEARRPGGRGGAKHRIKTVAKDRDAPPPRPKAPPEAKTEPPSRPVEQPLAEAVKRHAAPPRERVADPPPRPAAPVEPVEREIQQPAQTAERRKGWPAALAVCGLAVGVWFVLPQNTHAPVPDLDLRADPPRLRFSQAAAPEAYFDAGSHVAAQPPRVSPMDVAKREIASLDNALAALQMEKERRLAEVGRIEADALEARSAADLATVKLEALRRELTDAEASHAKLQADTAAAQERLDGLAAEITASADKLAGLVDEIAEAQAALAAIPKVPEPATDGPKLTELQPQISPADDAQAFYNAAIRSTAQKDIVANFAKAALRGHGRAATYLGQLFETGDGVGVSPEIASRWYLIADRSMKLHDPALAKADIPADRQAVSPVAGEAADGTADFVWQGRARDFTLELAGGDGTPIAFARTPLTAIQLQIPENAALWRVRTDGGAVFDWQPITDAPSIR